VVGTAAGDRVVGKIAEGIEVEFAGLLEMLFQWVVEDIAVVDNREGTAGRGGTADSQDTADSRGTARKAWVLVSSRHPILFRGR
jgi:hypothetical protein